MGTYISLIVAILLGYLAGIIAIKLTVITNNNKTKIKDLNNVYKLLSIIILILLLYVSAFFFAPNHTMNISHLLIKIINKAYILINKFLPFSFIKDMLIDSNSDKYMYYFVITYTIYVFFESLFLIYINKIYIKFNLKFNLISFLKFIGLLLLFIALLWVGLFVLLLAILFPLIISEGICHSHNIVLFLILLFISNILSYILIAKYTISIIEYIIYDFLN